MKTTFFLFAAVLINISFTSPTNSQSLNNYTDPTSYCGMTETVGAGCGAGYTLPFFPLTNDTLRALVVFCNFPSTSGNYDPGGSLLQYWPGTLAQTKPSWADSIICQ